MRFFILGGKYMNKIIVKIANQEYTIIGKEEKDYILSLASHVDEQITKASEKTPKSNIVTPVVLASINIADQYFKSLEENKRLSDIIETHNFGIINEKDKKVMTYIPPNRCINKLKK